MLSQRVHFQVQSPRGALPLNSALRRPRGLHGSQFRCRGEVEMLSGKSLLPLGDHASVQGISEGDAWCQMLESRILCRVTDSVERRMDEQAQPVRHCD